MISKRFSTRNSNAGSGRLVRATVLALTLLLAVLLLSLGSTASAGEYLGFSLQGGMEVTSYSCDPSGTSTVHYVASGNAQGSLSGSFTATGSFTVGPQNLAGYPANNNLPNGYLQSWSEHFTIDSPSGIITGEALGVIAPPPGFGISGAVINTATCAFVNDVTLGQVQNATGTVIHAIGTVGIGTNSTTLPSDTFAATVAVEMFIGSSSVGSFTVSSFDQSFFSGGIVPSDTAAPLLAVPSDVVVDAVSPNGAAAIYVVSATYDYDPAPVVTCAPASGTSFAIGDTTVTCDATDAVGNTANASFTVHVNGANEQLADLGERVTGVGPGTSLSDKVKDAQADVANGDVDGTCSILRAFINQVEAQSGKSIPPSTAVSLIADATRIRVVLGCQS